MQATDEQLEIVDEDDHLVGLGTRQQIHAERLWHRGSYVTLSDPHGKVLLTRRSATKANDPGRLEASIGEHVAPRETYLEAARRGLKEELEVEGGTHEEVRIVRIDLRRGSETAPSSACLVQIVGLFSFVYDGTIRPDPSEIGELIWVSPEELRRRVVYEPATFAPQCVELIRYSLGFPSRCEILHIDPETS